MTLLCIRVLRLGRLRIYRIKYATPTERRARPYYPTITNQTSPHATEACTGFDLLGKVIYRTHSWRPTPTNG
jgi:hypothetical protein